MRLSLITRCAVGSGLLATCASAAQITKSLSKSKTQRNLRSTEPLVNTPMLDAQDLFDYSMRVNDLRWDDSYNYIWYSDNGPWSTRFTAWYVAGLLYRNKGQDLSNAKAAIENM